MSIPGLVEVLRKEGLGDGGKDREDFFVRGPARGAQTAGGGDEVVPLRGTEGFLQELLGLRAGVLRGSGPSFRSGEDILAALG